jgi:Domain of unknown function (DUF4352)
MAFYRITRSLALTFGAVCVFLSLGCRQPTPAKVEFHIGDAATAGPLTYNVVEAHWKSQLDAFPSPRVPERNFLLVRITVTNSGGTELGIPFLKLENNNGDSFSESDDGSGVDRWLGLIRRINPAQTEDGWLLFDVPTNSYKLRLSDGAVENEHVAYVTIPLSIATDAPTL